MKAFVTGATGLLGSNLVHLLAQQGHEVKALARSRDKAQKLLKDTGAEIVVGDMEDVAAFAPALDGVDVLFHTAAYFREYYGGDNSQHWATLKRINIDAVLQLYTEAEKRGVKKAIHVSSSGTIGRSADGRPSDETTPPDHYAAVENLYFRSKVEGDKAIDEFLKTHTLPIVTVHPTGIFGPRDNGPTAVGGMMLNFIHGQLPAVPPGGIMTVDARDVAQGMINAVERGKNGEHYLLSGQFSTVAEIIGILSQMTGIPEPAMKMPYPVALTYAWVTENLARLTGGEVRVPVSGVRALNEVRIVTADKAKRELGATFRPLEETLRDEVQWYLDNGYIKAPIKLAVAHA
jgi:dihydroflavonol-4-reductase